MPQRMRGQPWSWSWVKERRYHRIAVPVVIYIYIYTCRKKVASSPCSTTKANAERGRQFYCLRPAIMRFHTPQM